MEGLHISSVNQVLHKLPKISKNKKEEKEVVQSSTVSSENEINNVLKKVQGDIEKLKIDVLKNVASGSDANNIRSLFDTTQKQIKKQKEDVLERFNTKAECISPTFLSDSQIKSDKDEKPLAEDIFNEEQNKNAVLERLKNIINPARMDTRIALNQHYQVPLPVQNKKRTARPAKYTNDVKIRRSKPFSNKSMHPSLLVNTAKTCELEVNSHRNLMIVPSPFVTQAPPPTGEGSHHRLAPPKQSTVEHPTIARPVVKFSEQVLNKPGSLSALTIDAKVIENPSNDDLSVSSKASIQDNCMVPAPLTSPNMACDSHVFTVKNGAALQATSEFITFKQYYCLTWASILIMLNRLEKLLTAYSIPVAYVDGDKLADMALYFEVGPKPTKQDLLLCIINLEHVEKIINIPGRRYIAQDGFLQAVIKVQSTWRWHKDRSYYLNYRQKKWAAGMIALTWVMKCKISMIRQQLRNHQIEDLCHYRQKRREFEQNWSQWTKGPRTIIHVPSLGYGEELRSSMNKIAVQQNQQIGRICDIKDPNVEVIYIAPREIAGEVTSYYERLMRIMADMSGEDYEGVRRRLKIVTPLCYNAFPSHNLSLATLLKYCAATLKRIKQLIKGKNAYIVSGALQKDDLSVASHLDVPILGSEPEASHLYTTKSGAKRIFEAANVTIPPSSQVIFTIDQLHECLAELVTVNLEMEFWLFKIDDHIDGKGTARCEVTPHLKCHRVALKQEERYGEKWKKKWAHEPTYNKVLLEIPKIVSSHSSPIDSDAYPTWESFLEMFLKKGGVIEGYPPSESVTGLTANLLIEPNGDVQILSTADQVHASSPLRVWGFTFPQTSVDPAVVNKASLQIAEECKNFSLMGHLSIDYVTFIHPRTNKQIVWSVGLKLAYTASHALMNTMEFVSGGRHFHDAAAFEVTEHRDTPSTVAYRSRRKRSETSCIELVVKSARYCVLSSNLFHTNLNHVHYAVFFQICKARAISYNEKRKIGTVFSLFDNIYRESLGMITFGETLKSAIEMFVSNLLAVHQDISSANMQGDQNFQLAIEDLRAVLKLLFNNENIDQHKYPTAGILSRDAQSFVVPCERLSTSPNQARSMESMSSRPSTDTNQSPDRLDASSRNSNRYPSTPVFNAK